MAIFAEAAGTATEAFSSLDVSIVEEEDEDAAIVDEEEEFEADLSSWLQAGQNDQYKLQAKCMLTVWPA